ncbi:MAG: cellulase family glycosylhydrolase [Chloroflexaceae bacterium]|nr:cellulase family glycosylhydrolase [Chloroflexaceae bacterium]
MKVDISGDRFTLDGQKTFLLGASYFDAGNWKRSDLDQLAQKGFNLVRIWVDWDNGGNSLADSNGNLRSPDQLKALVDYANSRGLVVDVTILDSYNKEFNPTSAQRLVNQVLDAVGNKPNVIFDIHNEYNLNGLSQSLGKELLTAAKNKTDRPVFISSYGLVQDGGNSTAVNRGNVSTLLGLGTEAISDHFRRGDNWYDQVDTRVTKLKEALRAQGKDIPVYLQEEHRNGWTGDFFTTDQLVQAAVEAKTAGAAAYIFHTDAGFQLGGDKTFFSQLDSAERRAVDQLGRKIFPTGPAPRPTTPTPTPTTSNLPLNLVGKPVTEPSFLPSLTCHPSRQGALSWKLPPGILTPPRKPVSS